MIIILYSLMNYLFVMCLIVCMNLLLLKYEMTMTEIEYYNFDLYSYKQNEDVDTSDGGSVVRQVAPQLNTPARQQSVEDNAAEGTSATTSSSNPEEGLPPGWSMQVAPNGRIFFIDHNDRKTSWVDPRTGRASPMPNDQRKKPEDDLGPLPEGWEERVQSDGRMFYIDHSEYFCLLTISMKIRS